MWPNAGHFVRKVLSEIIEPEIQKMLEQYGFIDFRFERIVLGQIPPRITGIKVYDKKSSRNQILLDLDVLYSSDCDITFCVNGLSSGIRDMKVRGTLRVELKPLISEFPLFGSLQAYFLSPPDLDFEFSGLANLLDLTGVSHILRTIIIEILGTYMVFPNKLPIWSLNQGSNMFYAS